MSKNQITSADRLRSDLASEMVGEAVSPELAAEFRRHSEEAARKKYKRARRRLLELAVWDDPKNPMGVTLSDYRATRPEDFDAELRKRAHAVAVAFDRYTECTVTFDPYIPKL